MDEGSNKHRRRSLRLSSYDYSLVGPYFVTICAYGKRCIFEQHAARGAIEQTWQRLPERFAGLGLDEFVIMPNHVHFIVWLPGNHDAGAGFQRVRHAGAASGAPTLGTVVRAFKSISAIAVNKELHTQGAPVWQRNYFERVVRDERELSAIREYILYNPTMWDRDCENPQAASTNERSRTIRDEIEALLEQPMCEPAPGDSESDT
jgi:REP element-mobilizing transposase RayT